MAEPFGVARVFINFSVAPLLAELAKVSRVTSEALLGLGFYTGADHERVDAIERSRRAIHRRRARAAQTHEIPERSRMHAAYHARARRRGGRRHG